MTEAKNTIEAYIRRARSTNPWQNRLWTDAQIDALLSIINDLRVELQVASKKPRENHND
jgi:hypothetical protein